jgi:hypothetical protein
MIGGARPVLLCVLLLTLLALGRPASASSQGFHVGGGVGPTAVLDGEGGNRNITGFVELQAPFGLGARLDGMETVSLFFLTANLTYMTSAQSRFVQTYVVLGGGVAVDVGEGDPEIHGGVGLAIPLVPGLRLFGEARVHRLLNSERERKTFLPFTFGLRLGLL